MTKEKIERYINSAALEEGPDCACNWFKKISEYLRQMPVDGIEEDEDY